MNRRNLVIGALFSIALISGVAWYGNITHWVRPKAPPPPPVITVTMPPLEPEPKDPNEYKEKSSKEEVSVPAQPDTPRPDPPIASFKQVVEPPRPENNIQDTDRIPLGGIGDGTSTVIVDLTELDQQPVVKVQVSPEYPYSLKQQGITGEVLVSFVVDASGNVRNAFAVRSSDSGFEANACKAVSRWKFKPGRKGGRAVLVRMEVPVEFKLDR
jgi:protein TonB